MTDRRLWLVAALLALAGIALNIVYWITRQPTNEQTYAGPPRSDYTLTDFTLNALDADGKLSFHCLDLKAKRRLLHTQSLGGSGNVALFSDGDEIAKLPQIHCHIQKV